MKIQVGINGFGRIGRQVFKAINDFHGDLLEVNAINDMTDANTNAHLLKYDSNYGLYDADIQVEDETLVVNGHRLNVYAERDPGAVPWRDTGVDIVIECTGLFTDANGNPGARDHIEKGGAQKVIISAPAKNEDLTVVIGVNEDQYDSKKHHVLSNASCTTNCLAPVAKVLNDALGIEHAVMTTIHAYTNDQKILDAGHRKELRRSRAAALNMIPTTTGAAKAVALVIPELKGKFDGYSLRVPTPTVSIVDLSATLAKATTKEELNEVFLAASESERLKGILGVTKGGPLDPLVSVDFKGDSRSAIVDLPSTMVVGGKLVKVLSWYDNEWGYSNKVLDLISHMSSVN